MRASHNTLAAPTSCTISNEVNSAKLDYTGLYTHCAMIRNIIVFIPGALLRASCAPVHTSCSYIDSRKVLQISPGELFSCTKWDNTF